MSINGSDKLLLKTTGGTIVKDQTVNDLGAFLSSTTSLGQICGGRLGLESGVPISTTDRATTNATTIYLNAYQSNWVLIYDGSAWVRRSFSTPSVAVPSVGLKNFDIFAYWTGSAVALETVNWTDNIARATSLARQDGILVKNGAATRLYLGTARTVASGQTESSKSKRLLWNFYNPVAAQFDLQLQGTAGATWDVVTPPRQISGNSANQVEAVVGLEGGHGVTRVSVLVFMTRGVAGGGVVARASVALDSKDTFSKVSMYELGTAGSQVMLGGFWEGFIPLGYHYFSANQCGAGAGTVCGWYMTGSDRGMTGSILC